MTSEYSIVYGRTVSEHALRLVPLSFQIPHHTVYPVHIDLFIPCFVDQMTPGVGLAVTRVLERLGHTVEFRPADLLRPTKF